MHPKEIRRGLYRNFLPNMRREELNSKNFSKKIWMKEEIHSCTSPCSAQSNGCHTTTERRKRNSKIDTGKIKMPQKSSMKNNWNSLNSCRVNSDQTWSILVVWARRSLTFLTQSPPNNRFREILRICTVLISLSPKIFSQIFPSSHYWNNCSTMPM